MGSLLWNRFDSSAVGLQFELYHRFWGKEKNAYFDMRFKLPLMFRFNKQRPLLLPGIKIFPKKAKADSLDDINQAVYLSYYIEQLHYSYKNFHVALEPARAHFLHNGLLLRENPFLDKKFARYTPAFSMYMQHSDNNHSGLYTSELGQGGMYLFYGSYRPLKKNSWYLAKEFRVSPISWSDFTATYKTYKEFGLGLEISTVLIKKNNFSFGLFSGFDFYYQPTLKTYAYRFAAGFEFHSSAQIFAIGSGMRSKNHTNAAPLSEFYPSRRNIFLETQTDMLPSFIFFTNPKDWQNKGFRFSSEIYFREISFSYRLEYFFKNKNITFSMGHGRESVTRFLDLKNFRSSPTYFSVTLEGSLLAYIHIHWQTRYYYYEKEQLTSYASFVFTLVPNFFKRKKEDAPVSLEKLKSKNPLSLP